MQHEVKFPDNPDFLHGSDQTVTGTNDGEIIGGGTTADTIIGGDGNDLILGDTLTSNSNIPLEYTAELDGLPFSPGSVEYSINGEPQSDGLVVGSDRSATVSLDSDVVGSNVEVQANGIVTGFEYEFFDSVPAGFSAENIPTTGADFTGTVDDLNVRQLALDLTGSHETYSVRYTAELHIDEGGTYTLTTRSDDGSILYINGEEVVSNDGLHGARTRSGEIDLSEGVHTIEILFFENGGGDNLSATLSGPDTNNQPVDLVESGQVGKEVTVNQIVEPQDVTITGFLPGLRYEFFDTVPSGFTVNNIPESGADAEGIASDLDVGALALEHTGSSDTYSVRYTGEINIGEGGTYDFSSLSDDGSAIYIDGQLVVLNDGIHPASSTSGSIDLEPGVYEIEILFFENFGGDVLDITFSGPDTNGETIDLLSSPNVGHRGEIGATEGGNDLIDAGAGDDTIEAGAGNDAIIGGEGADTIDGGHGHRDIVSFELSPVGVGVNLEDGVGFGGDAEGDLYENLEFIHGSTHDDILTGDEGVNRLVGHNGNDELFGGDGNDTLLGGRGADLLNGGDGVDTAEYDWSTTGVIVNLETGVGIGGYAHGDVLVGIENLFGSYFDDVLTGDNGTNRLNGFRGDDVLNGGAGNDTLIGGLGADQLNGGEGDRDVADYGEAEEGVVVDLVNGGSGGEADGDTYTGIEYVYGSDFDDTIAGDDGNNRIIGNDGDDVLSGGAGNDYFVGGAGADTIDGGEGNRDTVEYRDADEGVGVNLETGGFAGEADGDTFSNIEYVYGSDHADDITGNADANRLIGFGGDDAIDGGAGNDYIIGMSGDDTLTGGAGDDVFLYKDLFGADVITDFEAGEGRTDRIWLDLDGITEMSDITVADTTDGALITAGIYGTILLEGVLSTDLNADDFIF